MPKKESTKMHYQEIRDAFHKLNKNEYGVQKYTHKWLFAKLAKKFHKQPDTIEKIIFHRI